jgi:hypothetical protein
MQTFFTKQLKRRKIMDLIDRINQIASKIAKQKDSIATEEATKTAFIMPFIGALGYDVFDPDEVIPEFTADIGIKKGEKVDYAIKVNDKVSILIECKMVNSKLDAQNESQLHRYFHTTEARIGILTDGIIYKFYTDLDEQNKMDNKPFLEFSVQQIDDIVINELKKFTKGAFNIDELLSSASELKYTKEIKNFINEQLANPSDEFVRIVLNNVCNSKLTAKIKEQFTPIITKAFQQLLNDKLNDRLKSAIALAEPSTTPQTEPTLAQPQPVENSNDNNSVIAQEKLEGFYAVKSILNGIVELNQVTYKDTQSYFGIFNNKKPIIRLYFNSSKKYLCVFDADKKEIKILISAIDDIFEYKEKIIASVNNSLAKNSTKEEPLSD